MGGTDQLHASFRDRSTRQSFHLRADFIDNNNLRRVIFHRFDHNLVLFAWIRHLHPSCASNSWVWNVPITTNLVGRVDNHHPFLQIVRQHSRNLANDGCFPNPWFSEKQHRLTVVSVQHVRNHIHVPSHRSTNSTGQTNNLPASIPYARNPMQRPGHARAVVPTKLSNHSFRVIQLFLRHHIVSQSLTLFLQIFHPAKPRLRLPS